MGRTFLARAVVALAPLLLLLGLPAPAHAAGRLDVSFGYVCNIGPGQRSGNLVVTSADEAGTVTAFSVTPASVVSYITAPGPIGGNTTAFANWGAGPGINSVSMSITVQWPEGTSTTETRTLTMKDCMPHPWATLAPNGCTGSVIVTFGNGQPHDILVTGGHAKFEIIGAFGYRVGPWYVMPWADASQHTVPAEAASSITVLGEGEVVAQGGYVQPTACTAPLVTPPAGSGGGAGNGGGNRGAAVGNSSASASASAAASESSPNPGGSGGVGADSTASTAATTVDIAASSGGGGIGTMILAVGLGLGIGVVAVLLLWRRRSAPAVAAPEATE